MNARRSILFVLTTPDYAGGTERSTFLVASLLAQLSNFDIGILGIYQHNDAPFFADDVSVNIDYLIDARAGMPPGELSRFVDRAWEPVLTAKVDTLIAEYLADRAPDIIIATTPALLALVIQTAHARSKILAVEHRHTRQLARSAEPLQLYGAFADALVSLIEDGAQWFQETLGSDRPQVAVIPNPLPDDFAPRSSLQNPMVLAAGRMVSTKGFHKVISTFAEARQTGWRLRIFGDGPQMKTLGQLIVKLNLQNDVDLVKPVPDLSLELSKASIVLMASDAEGQPLVAMEALRAGVPVVSYDSPGGLRSVITDGEDGLIVPMDDQVALARSLSQLMLDPDLRQQMGQKAWRNRLKFEPALVAKKWMALIDSLLSDPSPPRRLSRTMPAEVGQRKVKHFAAIETGGLLLHLGPHKTGTTAIQSAFVSRRETLHDFGILYPGTTAAPHGAVMERLGTAQGWDDSVPTKEGMKWDRLCELTRTYNGTVVVSSEALCHADKEQAASICRELRDAPVRVVITLRPLEQIIPSSWQEYIKSGWTTTYEEFLDAILNDPTSATNPTPTFWKRQDHAQLVERWVEVVGPERVAVVVGSTSNRRLLFDSFEDMLSLTRGTLQNDQGSDNRSLSIPEVDLLRRLNISLRGTMTFEEYNFLWRQGGILHLVENRRPAPDEQSLGIPAWAKSRAREIGGAFATRIAESGAFIFGELEDLVPSTPIVEWEQTIIGAEREDIMTTLLAGVAEQERQRKR